MKFYCTTGRGTECFLKKELKTKYDDVAVQETDGKVFFHGNVTGEDALQQLLSLKSAERIFVDILHVPVGQLDKRGLLTLLHTSVSDMKAWQEGLDTLEHLGLLKVSPVFGQNEGDSHSLDNECPPKKRKTGSHVSGASFRVSCKLSGKPRLKLDLKRTSSQMAVLISRLLGWRADPRNPQFEVNIHLNDSSLTVGMPLTEKPLSQRSYIKHCGLRTTVAWIMADLLAIEPEDRVLDPMCGAGTILIEAAVNWKCGTYLGIDKDMAQLCLTWENLQDTRIPVSIHLIQGDATRVPLPDGCVDKVVTDAPFGQNHLVDVSLDMFYKHVFSEVFRVLKPNGKFVLLTSRSLVNCVQSLCASAQNSHSYTSQIVQCTGPSEISTTRQEPKQEEIGCHVSRSMSHVYEVKGLIQDCDSNGGRHFILKNLFNVKLGDTEGTICVMEK
ncbi:hypothetical protein DPMN_088310 [Dreissena polymorpha]|uniref:Ribosomal RNA large subunit methyltransferase K/L-like methyltransferase domain-containing protein n=1 Tax=Dreissena polymorpha TaxID=45954 RepID=A0A9D4QWE2_DREPO|nr:hypothetical protein DPMN_088310 [Dreissena polymorpha]